MSRTNRPLLLFVITALSLSCLTACTATPVTPTVSSPEAAVHAIRPILGLPDLPLTFIETTHMINSPDGGLTVSLYADSDGRKFYVDPQTSRVVEVDARNLLSPRPTAGSTLSAEELHDKAIKIAKSVIANYDSTVAGLTYEEGNKGSNYFYDWRDMSQPVVNMPPLVQIGLQGSGELFGYINTLALK